MDNYNNKINNLCNEIANNKNVGLSIIEEFDNDEFIQEVHNRAQKEIEKTFNTYAGYKAGNSDIVFLSLALISLHCYDSNFYSYVQEQYKDLYSQHSSQRIQIIIRETIRKYKRTDVDDSKRLITSTLMNSIVPKYFLPDFFDFAFDIYKINLSFTEEDIDKELFFVFDGLCKVLKDTENDDELKLNVRDTSYHLIQSTKKFIISEKEQDFKNAISFTKGVIDIIDKHYLTDNNDSFNNSYYKYGYEEWLKKHIKDDSSKSDKKRERSVFISRSEATVYFDPYKKKFMLCTPEYKFKEGTIDESQLYIHIYNGDKEIYKNNFPELQNIFGGYKIKSQTVAIDDPIGELRFVINEGKREIFDTKEKLKKSVFVFNADDGSQIKNNTEFSGNALFCYKVSNENIKILDKKSNYILGYKDVQIGDVMYFNNEPFAFTKMIKPGVVADKIEGLKVQRDDSLLSVYKDFTYLIFDSPLSNEQIGISINGKKHKLDSYYYRIDQKELWTQYIVSLPLNATGIYRIYAFDLKTNARIKNTEFKFGVDTNFHLGQEKIDSNTYKIFVRSGFFDDTQELMLDVNNIKNFDVPFNFDSMVYLYKLPLNLDLYKIDDGEWKNQLDSSIWIDDFNINSSMTIWGKVESVLLFGFEDTKSTVLETIKCEIKDNFSIFSIGCLKSYSKYSKVLLRWKDVNGKENGIWLDNTCSINEHKSLVEFNPITKMLNLKFNYYGKGQVDFEIFNSKNQSLLKKEGIKNNESFSLNGLKTLRKYKLRVSWQAKNLLLKKTKVLYEKSKVFYSFDDIKKCGLEVVGLSYVEGENCQEPKDYNGQIAASLEIIEKITDTKYTAKIFKESAYGAKIYKNNLGVVNVEIISNIHGGAMEVLITKNDKNLRFDEQNKEIPDSISSMAGKEIMSYTLKMLVK